MGLGTHQIGVVWREGKEEEGLISLNFGNRGGETKCFPGKLAPPSNPSIPQFGRGGRLSKILFYSIPSWGGGGGAAAPFVRAGWFSEKEEIKRNKMPEIPALLLPLLVSLI